MRRITKNAAALLAVGMLSLPGCLPVFAAGNVAEGFAEEYYRFQNIDGIMDDADAETLNEKLDEISHRQNLDVTAALVDSLDGNTVQAYADDLYDQCDFGYGTEKDGVLLLVSLEDHDWYISTCGYGVTAFTDAGIQYIGDEIRPELADGDYLEAFETYADQCDAFITQARKGNAYDEGHMPKKSLPLFWIPVSLLVGFGGALLVVGSMKSELKSVRMQSGARDYVRPGSLQVTTRGDYFLYHTISRTERPQAKKTGGGGSSTHTSSSGRTHGGGGGKF